MDREKIKQNIIRLLDKLTDAQLRILYMVGFQMARRP